MTNGTDIQVILKSFRNDLMTVQGQIEDYPDYDTEAATSYIQELKDYAGIFFDKSYVPRELLEKSILKNHDADPDEYGIGQLKGDLMDTLSETYEMTREKTE